MNIPEFLQLVETIYGPEMRGLTDQIIRSQLSSEAAEANEMQLQHALQQAQHRFRAAHDSLLLGPEVHFTSYPE